MPWTEFDFNNKLLFLNLSPIKLLKLFLLIKKKLNINLCCNCALIALNVKCDPFIFPQIVIHMRVGKEDKEDNYKTVHGRRVKECIVYAYPRGECQSCRLECRW